MAWNIMLSNPSSPINTLSATSIVTSRHKILADAGRGHRFCDKEQISWTEPERAVIACHEPFVSKPQRLTKRTQPACGPL